MDDVVGWIEKQFFVLAFMEWHEGYIFSGYCRILCYELDINGKCFSILGIVCLQKGCLIVRDNFENTPTNMLWDYSLIEESLASEYTLSCALAFKFNVDTCCWWLCQYIIWLKYEILDRVKNTNKFMNANGVIVQLNDMLHPCWVLLFQFFCVYADIHKQIRWWCIWTGIMQ